MKYKLPPVIMLVVLLTACNPSIKYKGDLYSNEQLEDVIEAELTEENPGLNIDVDIYSEDVKVKTKKVNK